MKNTILEIRPEMSETKKMFIRILAKELAGEITHDEARQMIIALGDEE